MNATLRKAATFAPTPVEAVVGEEISKSGEKPRDGALTQWANFMNGYAPTSQTIQKLDAGMYTIDQHNGIIYLTPKNVETDDLLQLPDSKSEEVLHEVEKFWTKEALFKALGFVHKRGFLMHGEPGSGKTATCALIAKRFIDHGGIVLVPRVDPGSVARSLRELRDVEPDRKIIVLLEDIDDTLANFGEQRVLALLDGEESVGGVCFLGTTNYPKKLPPRIVNRPSRFDRVVKIGMPTADARRMYLESRKALTLSKEEMDDWVKLTTGFSIAHIKEVVIAVVAYEVPVARAASQVRKMASIPDTGEGKKVGFGGGDDDEL